MQFSDKKVIFRFFQTVSSRPLSWNGKKSSSIIPHSIHAVHPDHHLFLSLFVFFLGSVFSVHVQVFLGCSPMSNFIYSRNSQTERLTLRQGVGKFSWQELVIAVSLRSMSFSSICLYLRHKYFFSFWIPAFHVSVPGFQCTLINCKTKQSQHKMNIKIKSKPMCILSRWHESIRL